MRYWIEYCFLGKHYTVNIIATCEIDAIKKFLDRFCQNGMASMIYNFKIEGEEL